MCSGSSIGRAPRGRVLLADDEQVHLSLRLITSGRLGFSTRLELFSTYDVLIVEYLTIILWSFRLNM